MPDDQMTDLSSVLQPVETARGLPNPHYVDQAVFEEERNHVMFANWAGIGFAFDAPNPGDVVPIDFMGMPLLIVRDSEGGLGVFQNTCRHRGMILVEEKKNVRGTIRCPYHSWCYGLKGELRSTPHVGGPGQNIHENIKRDELGLTEIRSYVWRDVIFVNVDGKAPEFEVYAAPIMARMRHHDKPLYHGAGFSFDVKCNWKLAVENYCESYHLPWIHPGLNSFSRLEDHYHVDSDGSFAGQGSTVFQQITGDNGEVFPDFEGLPEFWDEGAEYPVFFPNVLMAFQRDQYYAIVLLPQAVDQTIERVEIFYSFDPADRPDLDDLLAKNTEQWRVILDEDLFVVEGMQRGRKAVHFDGGKFSPVMDNPTYDFHIWAAKQIEKGRGKNAGSGDQ
ncbi:MAG: choline monooxygenase [Paracoccaceae bacterium]|jgi:choline monooxygenase